MIEISSKEHYWDLALLSWIFIAYKADIYRKYEIMENALKECDKLLKERVTEFDSIDPTYRLRTDAVIMQGQYWARQNQFERAEKIYLTLIDDLLKIKNHDNSAICKAYAYLCDLYMDRGLYEKVYPYYLLMERAIPEGKDFDEYRYKHMLYMGTYFIRKKDYYAAKQAVKSAFQKIDVKQNEGESASVITDYLDLMAIIYHGLNKYDSAVIYFEKSISLQDRDLPSITDTYEVYGDCLAGFNKFRQSLIYYQKIDSFFSSSHSFRAFKKAQILSKISDAQFQLKDYNQSLSSVQQAFYNIYNDSSYLRNYARNPELSVIQADKVVIRLLNTKSAALAELAKIFPDKHLYLKNSLETYQLATKVVDRFRHEISMDDFKQYFVSDIRPMYEKAVNTCWQAWLKDKNDSLINLAYYFIEKSKNQVLLDAISTDYAEASVRLPEKIINTGIDYRGKLISLQNLITKLRSEGEDSLQLSRALLDFAETQKMYENYLDMMETNYPKYYNLRFNNKVPSIRNIKGVIGKSVVVEYMASDSFIAIVAVDHQKSMFKVVRVNDGFYNRLDHLLNNLRQSPYSKGENEIEIYRSFVNDAFGLYEVLFKSVRKEFSSSDYFIVIPDGKLSYLPFDILLEKYPDYQDVNYRNLTYLLKSSVIHYEFSSSLMFQNSKTSTKKGRMKNYVGFSPVYPENSELRQVKVLGKESSVFLKPLKYSQIEVNAAASVFKGNIFTGENAEAGRFKEKAALAGIIHFAGHTYINDSIPELSCLFFSKPSGMMSGEYSKSVIYANEILNLNLNAFLVLLSTCESGTGKLLKGEGLVSIGRSFRYAGAQNIVMTMWKINDQSASLIINNFCRNIKRGKASDVSLRNAKMAFLQNANPRNTHPYYWSAFIFIGNNDPIIKSGLIYIIISTVISVLTLLLYLFRRSSWFHTRNSA
jgi:CHAT domain-containing protein